MIGTEYFVNTKINEVNHLALRYQLGENEMAWNVNSGENRHITEMYRYQTTDLDNGYAVHINVIPVFDTQRNSWELKYYLYNLDRDINLDVTPYIEVGVNSDIFNGRKYGSTQHITVALQLERLELGLNRFCHVQKFDVALAHEPFTLNRPYLIDYHTNQPISYGEYNFVATSIGANGNDDRYYNISLNDHVQAKNFQEWLDRVYYPIQPIYNEQNELQAPKPTHVLIRADKRPDIVTEIDIVEHWDEIITGVLPREINTGDTMLVEFIRKQGTDVLYLALGSWVVNHG